YELALGTYNGSTGYFEMWVLVPSLSHTSDTTFYLCYGDITLTTNGSSAAVWQSDNYRFVYHLESADLTKESSNNASTTQGSATTLGTGKIGSAASWNGTESLATTLTATVNTADAPGTSDFTLSIWLKTSMTNAAYVDFVLMRPSCNNS